MDLLLIAVKNVVTLESGCNMVNFGSEALNFLRLYTWFSLALAVVFLFLSVGKCVCIGTTMQ